MDDKDRVLLGALKRDARRSLVSLARDVALSRSATQERIQRLVNSGAIAGFTIVEGTPVARQSAHFLAKLAPGRSCAQTLPYLRKIPAIVAIHSIAGDHDILIRADADVIATIEQTRAAIAALPQIAFVTTHVTLERHLG